MIIEIRSHGGFGGITAATSRRIDTDAQPEPRAQELRAAFDPDALANMAATPCLGCPDRMRYAITVTDATGPHDITLSEGQIPSEMLDLLDDISIQHPSEGTARS